jgi:hypothetical protein
MHVLTLYLAGLPRQQPGLPELILQSMEMDDRPRGQTSAVPVEKDRADSAALSAEAVSFFQPNVVHSPLDLD